MAIFMQIKQYVKQYFMYFIGIAGVVFFWAGVWDGIGYLPYLENPLLSIVIGVSMLSASLYIFRKGDPAKQAERKLQAALQKVHAHQRKGEFHILYHDKVRRKEITLPASGLLRLEKEFLVLLDKGRESFIPFHRITEIKHQGRTFHKA